MESLYTQEVSGGLGSGTVSVAGATTVYLHVFGESRGGEAAQVGALSICTKATTVRNVVVKTSGSQPGTGSLVFTLQQNGVDTGIVITIPVSAPAGMFTSSTTVAFAIGDTWNWKAVNNDPTASATIAGYGFTIDI